MAETGNVVAMPGTRVGGGVGVYALRRNIGVSG